MADLLDAARWLPAAERAADAAGSVLRHYFRRGLGAELKIDASPVTLADREAERAIRAVLSRMHPRHAILGEEQGLSGRQERFRWVVDPIDGTRAFITGRPTFGTLIALLDGEDPVLGLIDQPISGERWIGLAGQPTRFSGGIGTIGTRAGGGLSACELSCTSPQMFTTDEGFRWHNLAKKVARASFGGDCYAYGLLALGLIDIVAEADMKFWDWAALLPIVAGAGGSLTDWGGRPLRADGDGRVLALADRAILTEVAAILEPTAPASSAGATKGATT